MASGATTRAQRAVGSSTWIAAEKENIQQLINQEMDEIEYPAQNEMDWLNEHMAEIFSRNQFNVTEIFKTPGKLRGKTPRTARKHKTPREARVPLSDIFSSQQNVRNSPAPPSRFHQEITKLAAKPSPKEQPKYSSPVQYHQAKQPTCNTDSGYHGMPDEDDEMDLVYSEPHKESEPESKSVPEEPEPEEGPEQAPEAEREPKSNQNTQRILEPEPARKPEHEPAPEQEYVETATQPLEDSTLVIPGDRNDLSPSVDRRTTDASFHSAREIAPSKESTVEPMDTDPYESTSMAAPKQVATTAHLESPREPVHAPGRLDSTPLEKANVMEVETHEHDAALDHHFDDIGSPSDGSTPDRPPIRKSSLSFASLPAREPITKRSMGGHRLSRISHIDSSKSIQSGYYGRQTGGARMTQILPEEHTEQGNIEDSTKTAEDRAPPPLHEESELTMKGTTTYNKSSTQLLHEKINMLGKSQSSRSTKSIPAPAPNVNSQVQYPELSSQVEPAADEPRRPSPIEAQTYDSRTALPRSPQHFQSSHSVREMTAESPQQLRQLAPQEDRMSRIMYSRSPERRSPAAKPFGVAFHAKSASTSIITSPRANTIGHQRTTSDREIVTPVSSPRRDDGPLSASKSRLQSIMKTAKGLFTSTGSVSAAARKEALSPSPTTTRSHTGLYPKLQEMFSQEPQPPAIQSPPLQEGRRTRSSTEREEKRKEKERQEMQRMEEQLRKSREQEIQKQATINVAPEHRPPPKSVGTTPARDPLATRPNPRRPPTQQSVREPEQSRDIEHKFAVPAKPHHQSKQNDSRRPVRPTRDIQKPKPQPVSIRVGTLSQRIPLSNSSLSSSIQEPTPNPTPAPKAPAPGVNKKGSKLSMQTNSSTSSFKSATSATSSKSKAVQAAEKKREEQREAQRKRAAQQEEVRRQEEARRQEQASRAEAERRERERSVVDDPKKLAHKQAIEKRRLENARKLEQQRNQQPTPVNDLGSILQQEKAVLQGSQRNDLPSTRPSRLHSIQGQVRPVNYPPPNPAKPPKRALEDESSGRPVTGKVGAAVHQADGKRRKTDDEIAASEPPIRSAMAPPIRQSNVRKEAPKQQMYNQGYSTMPPPPHHQAGPSLFKNPTAPRHFQPSAPVQSQPHRNGHPLEMSKFASGKIPFADNSNPPHATTHKTPAHGPQKILKSSPAYPNGDSIKLPEILTDSEDEDSDAEPYNVPDWAKPENLNNILISQEGKDGEQVFGPTAPLHMEEIFKDNKDRFKRFRDRTSSANWGGPDGLTQDEIKWDLAERERLKRNGGWTFATS
ncbi:inner centromere protein [Blastomyces dermatitidis ER-3]|uniref:Inner centromere protein n=1 Tax=Ajellomyces dermatitidis (strain ER-3 / ATCC MYA-2586) TaxID=559297 RepID=A0ABP2EXD6_AJEDR|nr:inner centromere protein [Blastomyces dermatitidis ER-3]EEQ87316.1 inner centromere protein [Blastomyces dermatitidis ER-3]